MGKSPGKWIKTLLFGKKATRSNLSKGREASKITTQKGLAVEKVPRASDVDCSVTSGPVFISTSSYVVNSELETGTIKGLDNDESIIASTNTVLEKDVRESVSLTDPEKIRKDLAATSVQAAFRGYLARRAFGALKGIIRLQALIRGHLVRRQAVATLYSLMGIIKVQALVRGQRVRSSGIGLEISTKFPCRKDMVVKKLNSKHKLFANVFVVRLVSSPITRMPLRTQYIQCEPNSVFSWLERWTVSLSWKHALPSRKITGSKPQAKKNYAMETESGRSKRGVRRNNTSTIDSGSSTVADPEKPKRILRKFSSPNVDSITENPQSELEKVKRNLRKVSNSMAETYGHVEIESDKSSPNLKKLSNTPSFAPYQSIEDSVEELKDDVALTPKTELVLETESKSIPVGVIDVPCDDPCIDEVHPLQNISGDDNIPMMNGGTCVKDDLIHRNPKRGKRRESFAAKSENEENGIQTNSTLPSYMAATESVKAKLRAQNSPRVCSDSIERNGTERNGVTRRHSLPSSTNSKLSSHSPRTQRLVQTNGKCAAKNDRALLSSRDGHEKLVQVEWRR
ncbi:protein IQ-DOMAIN 31-like [Phalaenopsis equestris]|uniref:protein IQ-DOMAIN 31-like n=1 Tax=Phalaenopsis equestris TaxID=78828 RepID=UPI0009E2B887|nr:protein IQ-DOMAIN 31-like [Phalaenopsis equestris]XP_020585560.1 protein IQ-DOMAIN 31-like [Phalaenopsis equestris]